MKYEFNWFTTFRSSRTALCLTSHAYKNGLNNALDINVCLIIITGVCTGVLFSLGYIIDSFYFEKTFYVAIFTIWSAYLI